MNALDIRLRDNKTSFLPGETVEGTVEWTLDKNADALELRLIWYTQGKGDTDVSAEDARRFEAPALSGNAPFRFVLPAAPYSFSGKLISLSWALEFVVMPGEDATRCEFTLSPSGREVLLPQEASATSLSSKQLPSWLQSRGKAKSDEGVLQQQNPFEK